MSLALCLFGQMAAHLGPFSALIRSGNRAQDATTEQVFDGSYVVPIPNNGWEQCVTAHLGGNLVVGPPL